MQLRISRIDLITGFRLLTLMFSFILFSIFAIPLNVLNHAIIILCLLIVNVIVILAHKEGLEKNKTYILWIVETLGIFIILSLTGGIYSHYFWMILNPVADGLRGSEKAQRIQLIVLGLLVILLYFISPSSRMTEHLYAVQMLFGTAIVVFYSYISGLFLRNQNDVNQALRATQLELHKIADSNKQLTMNIMKSVELLEKIAIVENYKMMYPLFIEYISIVLGTTRTFFVTRTENGLESSSQLKEPRKEIIEYIIQNKLDIQGDISIYQHSLENGDTLLLSKLAHEENVSFFGFVLNGEETLSKEMVLQQLSFISKLHRIMLAKMSTYQLKKELLIKSEQNRIAEEMHDNVNQQLFALSCQVFNLKNKLQNEINIEDIMNEINLMYKTLQKTNKDLKNIIYRMSFEKENMESILFDIETYLGQLSRLYSIQINHQIDQSIIYYDGEIQNNILRIINESVANAVKHGKAEQIKIMINSENNQIRIKVIDDGIGINQFDLMQKEKGIGLVNLKRIADDYIGEFKIEQDITGTGTCVQVILNEVKVQ